MANTTDLAAGFIGLGALGEAIAGRLCTTGVELKVWNRTREKAERFCATAGSIIADTPAALISRVPVVFICLSDSDAVEVVLRGKDGLLSGECAGKLIIDCTTNHHLPVVLFHELARNKDAAYLELPVAGSVAPARVGRLTLLASGDRADYERALPYLEKIGAARFFLGAPGQATRMKLINNLCLGAFMATLAEAMVTAEAAGISPKEALDVLAAGGGKSLVLDAKRDKLLEGDYSPHFSVAMIHKDLHYLQDLARDLERPVLTGSVVKELFGRAIQQGWGDEDFAAIAKVFEKDRD